MSLEKVGDLHAQGRSEGILYVMDIVKELSNTHCYPMIDDGQLMAPSTGDRAIADFVQRLREKVGPF